MASHQERLRDVLKELFQLDQAELDFGIYRIMNAKRDEVTRFLDEDLLPQVRQVLSTAHGADRLTLKAQLDEAVQQANSLGVDPDSIPKVQELKAKYDATGDPAALEEQVFSHLASFFRRYYHEGDFISLRRYKPGVYAIPYEGEEVKLHWANADQYYIKTSETLRDYTFKLPDGRRVHFKVVAADSETDNTKAAAGQERRFILAESDPIIEQDGELVIRFEHRPDPAKRKQAELSGLASRAILDAAPPEWAHALAALRPTEKNPNRGLLDKHLADYTARNTFDYFIHKDLGGFLRRELDFYIKNEVMHLDDIEEATALRVEAYLATVKAIRRIAHKIIDFVAQLEDFQKKLWLKKKFVVETSWCVTLDRVPEALYPEIAANNTQRREWVRLFAIDGIAGDMHKPGYCEPLTVGFLKTNPYLVLDTALFPREFTRRLLASLNDLDAQTDGLLVRGENFQALRLLQERYRGQVKCIYIDPPYNSKTSEIAYKNTYKHSSWLALMDSRLVLSRELMTDDGTHVVAIDENEQEPLGQLLSLVFPECSKVCVAVVHNKKGIQGDYFSYTHDYAYFCVSPGLSATNGTPVPEDDWEYDNLRKWGRESERNTAKNCFYPIYVEGDRIVGFGEVAEEAFHPGTANVADGGRIIVYPVDSQGVERKWRYARGSVERILSLLRVHETTAGEVQVHKAKAEKPIKTVWDDSKYIAGDYGTKWLTDLGLKISEDLYPKSIHTVVDSILAVSDSDSLVLDYFGGSGTTGHAVLYLNRQLGGKRRFILAEVAEHFATVLKPRILKVIYSKDWKDGKPLSREGSGALVKVIRIESYEDTLNNLELRKTKGQQQLLDANPKLREDYTLRYMLDVEGAGSLLDLGRLADPFAYTLKVATGSVGETREVAVDLVETFNYLLGLRVKHVDEIRGVTVVEGANPAGDKVLVLWRRLADTDNPALAEWFARQGYNTQDQEYDTIYVNGDNTLENLRRPDQTWKVRLIEEELHRLMFDTREV